MKDKKLQKYIRDTHEKYRKLLAIENWRGEVYLSSGSHKEAREGYAVAGEIKIDISYLSYKITLYPPFNNFFEDDNFELCENVIVHELCHIFTEPLYDIAIENCPPGMNKQVEREREQLTELMARSFYYLNKHTRSK